MLAYRTIELIKNKGLTRFIWKGYVVECSFSQDNFYRYLTFKEKGANGITTIFKVIMDNEYKYWQYCNTTSIEIFQEFLRKTFWEVLKSGTQSGLMTPCAFEINEVSTLRDEKRKCEIVLWKDNYWKYHLKMIYDHDEGKPSLWIWVELPQRIELSLPLIDF